MATVEGSLAQVKRNLFSKLDANSGFWQIPLHETNWNLTTFLTPCGRYYYKKLLFGLTSAPEIFCKEMSKITRGCVGVVVHIDDILVMGNNKDDHDINLKYVLRCIEESGMKLNEENVK